MRQASFFLNLANTGLDINFCGQTTLEAIQKYGCFLHVDCAIQIKKNFWLESESESGFQSKPGIGIGIRFFRVSLESESESESDFQSKSGIGIGIRLSE